MMFFRWLLDKLTAWELRRAQCELLYRQSEVAQLENFRRSRGYPELVS